MVKYTSLNLYKKNKKVHLFVSLLMKHGKKNRALYILEVAILLFLQSIYKYSYIGSESSAPAAPKVQALLAQKHSLCSKDQGKKTTSLSLEHNIYRSKPFAPKLGTKSTNVEEKFGKNMVIYGWPLARLYNRLDISFNPKFPGLSIHLFQKSRSKKKSFPLLFGPEQEQKQGSVEGLKQKKTLYKTLQNSVPLWGSLLQTVPFQIKSEKYSYFVAGQKEKKRCSFFKTFPYRFSKSLSTFYVQKVFFFGKYNNKYFFSKTFQGWAYIHTQTKALSYVYKKRKKQFLWAYPLLAHVARSQKPWPSNYKPYTFSFDSRENVDTTCIKSSHNCQSIPKIQKNIWYINIFEKHFSWRHLTQAQKNTCMFSLYKAISNVKPPLECRSKRFGGSSRQIPATVSEHRQWGYAVRWIIEAAQNEKKNRNNKNLHFFEREYKVEKAGGKTTVVSTFLKETSDISKSKSSYMLHKSIPATDKSRIHKKQKTHTYKYVKGKIPLFSFFLAEALKNAYYRRGYAIQKRNLWIDTALANRAYLRYRWW